MAALTIHRLSMRFVFIKQAKSFKTVEKFLRFSATPIRKAISLIIIFFRVGLAIPRTLDAYEKCSMYAVNFTEMLEAGIEKPDPTWLTQPCKHGWEYNFTDIPYSTIATEVCLKLEFHGSATS